MLSTASRVGRVMREREEEPSAVVELARVAARSLRAATSDPARLSFGEMAERQTVLIEVEDVDGRLGFGECWANHPRWSPAERVRIVIEGVAPTLVGFELGGPRVAATRILSMLLPSARQAGASGPVFQVVSGFETALWDLLGKQLDVGLMTLLGGGVRSRVPAYASALQPGDDALLARLVEGGVRAVKCRVGFDHSTDVGLVSGARAALGEHATLFADANRAWSPAEAVATVRTLAAEGIDWIEEPLSDERPSALVDLTRATGVPVALGENRYGLAGFVDLAGSDAITVWQPDVSKLGGVAAMAAVSDLAAATGARVVPHCYGGPVALAATLQVAAARMAIERIEYDVRDNPLHRITATPMAMADDHVDVPDGPGLGIELDDDAIREYEEHP